MRFSRLIVTAAALVSIVVACSSAPTKTPTLCTPNKPSYCRCQDREQGTKICAKDGQSFGTCDPCETPDNPEGSLEPGDPGTDEPIPSGDDDDTTRDAGPKTPVCGDGVVDNGEDCDDANGDDADGCNRQCKLAGTTPDRTASCPGLDVDVWGGPHQPTLTSTTSASGTHKTKDLCAASGSTADTGAASPDRIFHVTAHQTGSLTVAVTNTTFNAYLYVASNCDDAVETATSCVNRVNGVGDEKLTFSVTAGKSYTVFIDGASLSGGSDESEGAFKVTFSIE